MGESSSSAVADVAQAKRMTGHYDLVAVLTHKGSSRVLMLIIIYLGLYTHQVGWPSDMC
jgi:hypothetical protein